MELRDYINLGIVEFGTISELAEELGLQRESLSAAKAHRRGLPAYAIVKLAGILNIDIQTLIAASELVTERKEEKRAFWLPFVTNAPNISGMAKYAVILGIVTNFVTPSPAEAAQIQASSFPDALYYVKSRNIPHCHVCPYRLKYSKPGQADCIYFVNPHQMGVCE